MNKRFTAIAVTVASLPLTALAAATPALAAQPCDGVYPPSQSYNLHLSPSYLRVNRGATVEIFTRLVRGNLECSGERVGYYTRGRGKFVYNLSRATTTGGRGLVSQRYHVRDDFRYFTDFLKNNTRLAKSPGGLIQIARASN